MTQPLRLRGINGNIKCRFWDSDSLLRVGRLGAMEIVLDDISVGRRHAEIRRDDEGWWVRDLNSSNGTYVNGVRLGDGERQLHSRAIIQFGTVAMMVEIGAPSEADLAALTMARSAAVMGVEIRQAHAEPALHSDVESLLATYRGRMSHRKYGRLALAFASMYKVFSELEVQTAINTANRCADGLATEDERYETRARAEQASVHFWSPWDEHGRANEHCWELPAACARHNEQVVAHAFCQNWALAEDFPDATDWLSRLMRTLNGHEVCLTGVILSARGALASRLRRRDVRNLERQLIEEICRPLFHPIALDPRWLTSTVVDLAKAIFKGNAFDRMPILADALMDAGCDSDEIIRHCRGPGPHVKGCWVVDLLLGKD